jgi:hypothetical protein
MTDIVPFQPPRSASSTSLELAPEAWKLASRVADTDFVPKALRGKPEAVLACILAGHEAGISPMQSLAKIHVVEGRPAMAAELMRALVLRAGHELWIEESTSTRVVVCGQRAGSERVSRVAWTMDDARRANLAGKNNWKSYPRAMLLARATAELCRALFPDVLAGISHTIEELADGDDVDRPLEPEDAGEATAAPAAPARTARARRAATAPGAAPAMEPEVVDKPVGEVPGLPGEEDDIIDAEVVEPAPELAADGLPADPEFDVDPPDGEEVAEVVDDAWEGDPDPPNEVDPGPRYSGPQIIAIKLAQHGVHERPDRLRAISKILDREVGSSKDLTADEVTAVIEHLDQLPEGVVLLAGQTEPEDVKLPAAPPRRTSAVTPPEEWTGDRWREFLRQRKAKAALVLKEANRIGGEKSPPVTVGTLDDLAGSGICSDLVGWIEEASS